MFFLQIQNLLLALWRAQNERRKAKEEIERTASTLECSIVLFRTMVGDAKYDVDILGQSWGMSKLEHTMFTYANVVLEG